ncbi:unnamed protein product [marine sediment metagenome]|uniref:Uncharacterized protein n=1 Tax=marine sediment metagenome TaxID=412755 RepID=X1DST8_9ZZZZ
MATIEVEKSTKERLIRLGGASSLDETIRSLMKQAKELAEYKAESQYIFDSLPRA